MMSEADQIAYAIKMSLQGDGTDTPSGLETPNQDSSRETTPMDTNLTHATLVKPFFTNYN